jgi:starvation-inducible DNA-binding protein
MAATKNQTFFKTRNDMPADTRGEMIALLNQHLADLTDLYSQTKQAHWNVRGMEFMQLHKLFDKLAEEQLEFIDAIAERATSLGGLATGTVRMAAKNSRLSELPAELSEGAAILKALADRYADYAKTSREAIETSEKADDMVTSDLFIEITGLIDQQLWFIEAHLQ